MVPPRSCYKFNVALKSLVGGGCAIRDCGGHLVAANSAPIPKAGDSLWMLQLCRNLGLRSLLVECSIPQLLSLLKSEMCPLEINELLKIIRDLTSSFYKISFHAIPKQCKKAATVLI